MTEIETKSAYDKNLRPIKVGDVLKVFHFIGSRKKRHYMYKQVVDAQEFGKGEAGKYLLVSHLNLRDWADKDGGYSIGQFNQAEPDVEIVQSAFDDFERRAKQKGQPC